jgi:5-methylcytosine-specific restriction endonuclease McrA
VSKNQRQQIFCTKVCSSKYYRKNNGICVEDGCSKFAQNKNPQLCTTHYTRLRVHGNAQTLKKIGAYPKDLTCKVDNCKNKILGYYMCNKHYMMWRKHGDPKGGRYEYKIRKAVTHSDGTRTCSECEKRLPINNFHKDKNATDGFRSKCKTCRLIKVKEWYGQNPELRREKQRDRYHDDVELSRANDALRYVRDREKRIELASEHSQIRRARQKNTKVVRGISKLSLKKRLGTQCYYCKKEMDFKTGTGRKFNRDMATIEHLIPLSKGGEHTFENTVLACRYCNLTKHDKTESEFKEFNS